MAKQFVVTCPRCGNDQQIRGSKECTECGLVWTDLVGPYYTAVGALSRAEKRLDRALKYDIGPKTQKVIATVLIWLSAASMDATAVLGGQDAES